MADSIEIKYLGQEGAEKLVELVKQYVNDRVGAATDEQVSAWFDAHPEVTTSVLDGSISLNKLASDVIDATIMAKADNLYFDSDTSKLYLMSNGSIIGDGVIVATSGGGSGGSSNNASLTLQNTTGWLYKTISQESSCDLSFTWSSLEDGISTGVGAMTVKVGGVIKYSATVGQGPIEIDVSGYLNNGSNSVRIEVTDAYGNARSIAFTINVISLILESSFDASIPYTGAISFPYTPTGNVEKTVRFILDGTEIGHTVTSVSGRQQSFTIPAQSHGSHTFRVYFESVIDGETVPSNELYYDLICLEDGNTTPIITSQLRNIVAEEYVTFMIPYAVYDPQSLTATVTMFANGTELNTLTVDRTVQTWSYRPETAGELTLQIKCTGASGEVTTKEFKMEVAESQIDVEVTTEDLALYLSAQGRSNNEEYPATWAYNDIEVQFDGFNFNTDGWHVDEDGATVMRVSGDARLTIPYKIFANDFRTTGKTIELEFATRDVLNYDAVLLSCMSGGRGLEVTTQKATLTSEQSTIGTQYKEEEHVRLSFVIEKKSGTKLLLCYINGILSGSVQYPDDDDFSQATPVNITIGNNDCTTDIYNIRVYDNNLTRYQIIDNWIGDTQNGVERKARYERNNVYDDYGAITPETLKKDLPYLMIVCPTLPTFKGDKKTCSGYYVDPVDPTKNFTFEGAQIDVQGTSSQYYYKKNFKIKFKNGFTLHDGTFSETYQLNDKAVPTSTYTFKADVASSEGANNVVLAQIYNDLCPVKTPPQEEDSRVRQTIDGLPIVIFWDNGSGIQFYAKFNFNHDKGTPEVFGFSEGDESWEILQNGTERTGFRSADFSGVDWKNDFEARYPEDNVYTANLAAFAEWLVSTNAEAATDEALESPVTYDGVEYTTDSAEYRLAKFKMEFADHADVDAMVFYYVITELFLCIDQREKNAFPTLWRDDPEHWMMLFYDADSSLGIDNKGNLAFDYYLEDIDYTEAGDPVFNGQASVLWVNLRKCFYAEIEAEYKRLRTTIRNDGSGLPLLSYDVANGLFESHQGKWSEAIYNEDGYRKSIEPYVLNGDTLYLPMLQGKKEQQRKWWLYNRFRYLDSKYNTGSSMETRITIRAHAQANIKLISYVNMYGHVYYNAEMAEHRMYRGREYEFEWAATGAEDAVIGINDADMLTSLGDLSPLMVELIDISKATHLTYLKVGDSAEGYVNRNLNSITLGNNVLLKTMDFRNCVTLAQAVDASGCTGLEEAYFDGTAITGLSLPNGGNVKVLHLPETITNLTLRNQTSLTDFTLPSYSNITTLWLENNSSVVDSIAILNTLPTNSRVRVIGFSMSVEQYSDITDFIAMLDTMRGLDENGNNVDRAQVSGTIYIEMLTQPQLDAIAEAQKRYPNLAVLYSSIETYTVNFYNYDNTPLYTVNNVAYGSVVEYVGETPVRENATELEDWEFIGWSPTIGAVTSNIDYYAQFKNNASMARALVARSISGNYSNHRITYVGKIGFGYITGLTSVDIPNVTRMCVSAFEGCVNLTHISIPPTFTEFESRAFYGCHNLTGVYITDLKAWCNITCAGNNTTSPITYAGKLYLNDELVTSVNITDIAEIGSYAFHNASDIVSVNLPNTTRLGYGTFRSCTGLTSLDLPSLTKIDADTFSSCSSLQYINLPNLKDGGASDFYGCVALEEITLPSYIGTVYGSMFGGCTNLKKVSFGTGNISFGRTTAFINCVSLVSLILPCDSLCKNSNINNFDNTPIASGTGYIYVPRALVDSYKTATNWSAYATQFRALEDYTVDGTITGELDETKI